MNNNDRSKGREVALKFLYNKKLPINQTEQMTSFLESLDDDLTLFLESYQIEDDEHPHNKLNDHSIFFGKKLIVGVFKEHISLEELIQKNIGNWTLEKLELMDRCLLMLGSFEISKKETPPQVVINESINLAKAYGTEQSFRFINGVLDGINNAG